MENWCWQRYLLTEVSNIIVLCWDVWSTSCPSSSFPAFEIACYVLAAHPSTVNHRAGTEFSFSLWSVNDEQQFWQAWAYIQRSWPHALNGSFSWKLVSPGHKKTKCQSLIHCYKSLNDQVIACENCTPSISDTANGVWHVVILHILGYS